MPLCFNCTLPLSLNENEIGKLHNFMIIFHHAFHFLLRAVPTLHSNSLSHEEPNHLEFHFILISILNYPKCDDTIHYTQDHVQFSYASFSSASFIIMISSRIKCPTFATCVYCDSDAIGYAWLLYVPMMLEVIT